MKKLIILLVLCLFSVQFIQAQWTQITNQKFVGGDVSGYLKAGNFMFAYTDHGGIFKSADSGRTWVYSGFGLDTMSNTVRNLVYFSGTLYARMDNMQKVYISTNNGVSWSEKTNFTGFPSNSSLMSIGGNATRCFALAMHHNMPDSVFLYYSSNGTDFTKGPLMGTNSNWDCELYSDNQSKTYIRYNDGTGNKLYYTTDGTTITTLSLNGLSSTDIEDLFAEKSADHVYLVSNGDLFKYDFGLQQWNSIKKSPMPVMSQVMNFAATDIAIFTSLLDFTSGLTIRYYRSLNRGGTWQEFTNTGMSIPIINRLSQVSGRYLVASTDFGECFYSSDTGRTWNSNVSGFFARKITSLESIPGKLFTSFNGINGVMMSDDQGVNWQYKNNGLPQLLPGMIWMEEMFKVGNNLYAIVYVDPMSDSLFIFKSSDGGDNWSKIMTPNAVHFNVYGKHGNNVIIRTGPDEPGYDQDLTGQYYIFDGTNWTPINLGSIGPYKKILSFCGDGSTLFMFIKRPADLDAIFSSMNNGSSWAPIYQAQPYYNNYFKTTDENNIRKVVCSMIPSSQSILVTFYSWVSNTRIDSIFKFTGPSWSNIGYSGLPSKMSIENISYFNGICYLTTTAGVFTSSNLNTWQKMQGANFYPGVEGPLLVQHGGDLFLGTLGNGLWVSSSSGVDVGKDVTICLGDSVMLKATGADSNFTWCCGLGTTKTVWVKPGTTTSYWASAINAFGVTIYDTVKVNVVARPVANFTIDKATQCPTADNQFTFTNTSTNATSYLWNFGDGNYATTPNAQNRYTNYVTHAVKLIAKAGDACYDSIIKNIGFYTLPPAVITAGGPTTFCEGSSVTLYANTGAGLSYQWLKNGNNISGATNPYLVVTEADEYSVQVTSQATTCSKISDPVSIIINPRNFNLSFTASPRFFTAPPFNVAFDNLTPNLSNYNFTWYFGDNTTTNTTQAFHSYLYNGLFTVKLVAEHKTTGCYDTVVKEDYISCSGGSTNPCTINPNLRYPGTSTLICKGDSLKLMADTGWNYTYIWTFNGNVISGANKANYYAKNGGEYRAIITSPVCSLTTYPLIVSVYATNKPVIQTTGSLNPCANDSMELFVTTYYPAYKWSTGATTNSIFIKNSGEYWLTITDAYGCKVNSDPVKINKSLLAPPQICLVTVEPSLKKNLIAWERPTTQLIDYYNVYKETFQADVYELIGSVDYDSLSVLVDTASIPAQRANRYRLTLVDTCHVESAPSIVHKTMHLSANKGVGNEVNLIWSNYEGLSFSSYKIYRGTTTTNLTLLDSIPSNLTSYTDLAPPTGLIFYQVSVIKKDTCFPAIKRGMTTSGPFSQSLSNLKDFNSVSGPYLQTTITSLSLDSNAGSTTIDVFTNQPTWSATADQPWLTLTPDIPGQVLKVDYTANPSGSTRTATITLSASGVTDVNIPVTQSGTSSIPYYQNGHLLVYPVPSTSWVYVTLPAQFKGKYEFEVLDVSGRTVMSGSGSEAKMMLLDISQLSRGMYYLRLNAGSVWYAKIIRQ